MSSHLRILQWICKKKEKKKEIMWMSYLELRACILCTEQKSNEMDGTKKQNEQKI